MGNPNMELKTAGQQSISWTQDGLIVTDTLHTSRKIRIIGGQILYNRVRDGLETWETLLSSDGISAAKLTAGTINTDKIEIASKDSPALILNKYGLTAYDWIEDSIAKKVTVNHKRGVRFDKLGIYGYEMNTGEF
jgi:hypothetical protein